MYPRPPLPLPPYSKTDDLYATGMTILEIYTGEIPYGEADEDAVEDLIRLGIRVDLSLIDNTEIRNRIVTYLDADIIPDNIFPQPWRCIAMDLIFCRCTSTPPHTYRKLFRCQTCEREDLAECRSLYVLPIAEALPSNLTCINAVPYNIFHEINCCTSGYRAEEITVRTCEARILLPILFVTTTTTPCLFLFLATFA